MSLSDSGGGYIHKPSATINIIVTQAVRAVTDGVTVDLVCSFHRLYI